MQPKSIKPSTINPPPSKLSYPAREAASLLGISVKSLTRLERRGVIRASKALRVRLFSHEALCQFLADSSR